MVQMISKNGEVRNKNINQKKKNGERGLTFIEKN